MPRNITLEAKCPKCVGLYKTKHYLLLTLASLITTATTLGAHIT